MSHTNLENYFKEIFSMVQHHKYSIRDIEDLIPFEKDIYVGMLIEYLKQIEQIKGKA